MPATEINDAELIELCRAGDRDAFRMLVDRYQGAICALTYSATGDIALSEDLAQDTFISAWKKLETLREPAKVRAWLCTIARNKVRDLLRRKKTDIASQATPVDSSATEEPEARDAVAADALAIGREEQQLLWRTLEQLPEIYREPLVLYYRQDKNVREVGETLELSDAVVRQRLVRGRAELKKEIAAFVEGALPRSGPSAAFTAGVFVALSAAAPSAAAAAVTAKGTAVAKGAGLLSTVGIWVGPIVGFLGGVFGTWCSYKSARSPRERRFVLKMAGLLVLYIALFITSLLASQSWLREQGKEMFIIGQSALWIGYMAGLVAFILVATRVHRRIQIAEGTYEEAQVAATADERWKSRPVVYGALGGAIFGSLAWLMAFALQAADIVSAAIVVVGAMAMFTVASRALLKHGYRVARKVFLGVWAGILALTFLMVNLRFLDWVAVMEGSKVEELAERIPVWGMNVLLATVGAGVGLLFWLSMSPRHGRRNGGSGT